MKEQKARWLILHFDFNEWKTGHHWHFIYSGYVFKEIAQETGDMYVSLGYFIWFTEKLVSFWLRRYWNTLLWSCKRILLTVIIQVPVHINYSVNMVQGGLWPPLMLCGHRLTAVGVGPCTTPVDFCFVTHKEFHFLG